MIPLKDDNPRVLTPYFNYGLVLCNIAIFFYQLSRPDVDAFVHEYGAIPTEIMAGTHLSGLLSAMFLHGGWMHLLGNMLYLWIFGDNIEGLMGHSRYIIFYLLCGIAATMAHIAMMPNSDEPMIGASGAISGVLGAYLVKFPRARILILVPIIVLLTTFRIPALFVLGFWFLTQLTNGLGGCAGMGGDNVAWFAHIGGFVAGVLLVKLFERKRELNVFQPRDPYNYTV